MRGADTEGGQQQQLVRAQGGPLVLDVSDMSTQQRSRFLEKLLLPARSLEGIVAAEEVQNRDCVIVAHALAMTLPVPVAGAATCLPARCSMACRRANTIPCYTSISLTCNGRVSFSSLICARASVISA